MYLKFSTQLDFPELANALCPGLSEESINWDSENVYEWMYVDLPELSFSLNVSREHGWAEVSDDLLDVHNGNDADLKKLVKPGPVYVFGWSNVTSDYIDLLPDSLAKTIAQRLAVEVAVYPGRINVDNPDPLPLAIFTPSAESDRE